MADRSRDDLNQTPPSVQDEENRSSEQPGSRTTEEITDKEDVEEAMEDEKINDRFQATDN
jgi:hypothetical protein